MGTEFDRSVWQGRTDPEINSDRWHQRIEPLTDQAIPGCALIGFASDAGVARNRGRVGAAEGPTAIRQALAPLAWHRHNPAYDAGTVHCQGDGLESAQQALAERLVPILDAGHLPIVLGGGHEVAYASWCGLASHLARAEPCPRVAIINLDAHFDLRDHAHVRSSGTPFSQIAEDCQSRGWPFHYACLGVSRSANTQALYERAATLNVMVREDRDMHFAALPALQRDLNAFIAACDHVYLTIDLDVLPAAEAPGVSAPSAHGVSITLLEPLIETVRDSGKLRLADLAELNPTFDLDRRTAKVAARLIHALTLNG
ncbi:formimidoylglutamase [Marinobacter sp. X15-166B]|uniref:formimidoylglutamase n=1 Tax=Marinobacter sp. X15-166B TaxID=1897620 RepID=UPI00085BEC9D|nr:formimidoylglutamase [Marinobacter sp. X15-166B]OEY65369.1 formimidoylglutamase [Marinobacter sp. X15-166B]